MAENTQLVRRSLRAVRQTPLVRHADVITIVYVLRGTLDVRVSCERFLLDEGDYAVLNSGDPHQLIGSEQNVTALLHLSMSGFADRIPSLPGVIFACESFDLPRFRETEGQLRNKLLRVLSHGEDMEELAAALLTELVEGYAFEDYYERRSSVTKTRRTLFHEIVMLMRHHIADRDALQRVADALHYQKGSLSRIVRETTATSFSDLLTFLRVAEAEIRLLETNDTMMQIARECGFSDVKYFTRAFRAWFVESPADYRRQMRPLVDIDTDETDATAVGTALIAEHRRATFHQERLPQLSFTPLLVKNLGRKSDLLRVLVSGGRTKTVIQHPEAPSRPHLLPIPVSADGTTPVSFHELIRGVDRERYHPVLVAGHGEVSILESVITEAHAASRTVPEVWLSYGAGEERWAENESIRLGKQYGVDITPMRFG